MKEALHFNLAWNKDYDFSDFSNIREIEFVQSYDLQSDPVLYVSHETTETPWGYYQILSLSGHGDAETCMKEISVRPYAMLSLQRHQGRSELWEVAEGALGVVLDGAFHELHKGQTIFLPRGCAHAMINLSHEPLRVYETLTGLCRERDNVRLADGYGRAVYPVTSETEYKSVLLYRDIFEKREAA